jgi:hypothetical protein
MAADGRVCIALSASAYGNLGSGLIANSSSAVVRPFHDA